MNELGRHDEMLKRLAKSIVNGQQAAHYERPNVSITVRVEDDDESRPADFDCYTADEIAKFGTEWKFVNIELTLESHGVSTVASLGAVELGNSSEPKSVEYLADAVLSDLLGEAMDNIVNARDAIDDL